MTRRGLVVSVALAAVTAVPAQGVRASGVTDLPPVTQAQLSASIREISSGVKDIALNVDDLDTTSTDGAQTLVSLKSDVLFRFGQADLARAAVEKIGALLAKAPKNARVTVHGHTDSIGAAPSNLRLSQARARSVAAAIRVRRPDLRLDARGYGESQPVEPNILGSNDNPDGRAKNRRVEIRYAS